MTSSEKSGMTKFTYNTTLLRCNTIVYNIRETERERREREGGRGRERKRERESDLSLTSRSAQLD